MWTALFAIVIVAAIGFVLAAAWMSPNGSAASSAGENKLYARH